MFQTSFRLPFRILGIPIQFDISFLVILPVLAWVIASNISQYVELFELPIRADPLQSGWTPYWIGLVAALGLFASVLVHEFGHSVVGRSFGMRIRRITLWILGGMAQFERMPRRPGAEAIMAIAGPITSFLIAGLCWASLRVVPESLPAGYFILSYLFYMNMVLAVFNLIPALPLDGGRVLRSLLALRMSWLQATRYAAGISHALAIGLGLIGFLFFNPLLILIALFVYFAGTGESQMAQIKNVLENVKVESIMDTDLPHIQTGATLSELAERMLRNRQTTFVVRDPQGEIRGMVDLGRLKRETRQKQTSADRTVSEIMYSEIEEIEPGVDAYEAFQTMNRNNTKRLLVRTSDEKAAGVVTRSGLLEYVQILRLTSGLLESEEFGRIPTPTPS